MWNTFMHEVVEVNRFLNRIVWGIPMISLMLFTGILLSIRTRFFQIIRIKEINRQTFLSILKKDGARKSSDQKTVSQFQALSTALAATIGNGNIAGVATAIVLGGPGAIFWMWISAMLGMMTIYTENVLAIYFRTKNRFGEWCGGPMYYIKYGLDKKLGKSVAGILAGMFATFCILASFGIGNMTQINSMAEAMKTSFHISPVITGGVTAFIISLVILGGIKRIGKVTEKIVPFMSILYVACTLAIFLINYKNIPAVFSCIFKDAFCLRAAGSGALGYTVKQAVMTGFKRGIFSNEAGLGSTGIINSSSDVVEPAVQGMWGIFEVFVDTIIMCTLTAFAVLSSNVQYLHVSGSGGTVGGVGSVTLNGVSLVEKSFTSTLGPFAGYLLALEVALFAFATLIGWSYYGTKCVEYLLGERAIFIYKCVFIVFIVIGAVMDLELVWSISDTLNGFMAIPNLIAVLLLSGVAIQITDNYLERKGLKKKRRHINGLHQQKKKDEEPLLSAFSNIQKEQLKKL